MLDRARRISLSVAAASYVARIFRFSNEKGIKQIEKATVSGRLSSLLPVVFSGKSDCFQQSSAKLLLLFLSGLLLLGSLFLHSFFLSCFFLCGLLLYSLLLLGDCLLDGLLLSSLLLCSLLLYSLLLLSHLRSSLTGTLGD